jgi:hypothetical protein
MGFLVPTLCCQEEEDDDEEKVLGMIGLHKGNPMRALCRPFASDEVVERQS